MHGQLGAVVHADALGEAALGGDAVEDRGGLIDPDRALGLHRQRLAGELVDDVE